MGILVKYQLQEDIKTSKKRRRRTNKSFCRSPVRLAMVTHGVVGVKH